MSARVVVILPLHWGCRFHFHSPQMPIGRKLQFLISWMYPCVSSWHGSWLPPGSSKRTQQKPQAFQWPSLDIMHRHFYHILCARSKPLKSSPHLRVRALSKVCRRICKPIVKLWYWLIILFSYLLVVLSCHTKLINELGVTFPSLSSVCNGLSMRGVHCCLQNHLVLMSYPKRRWL